MDYVSNLLSLLFNVMTLIFLNTFTEWSNMRKTLDHQEEHTQNGRLETQQPEETKVLPVVAPVAPPGQVEKVAVQKLTRAHMIGWIGFYTSNTM